MSPAGCGLRRLWLIVGLALAGCGSQPHMGTYHSGGNHYVAGHPMYRVGEPYQIKGVWYYPAVDYNYDKTGTASWYGEQFHGRYTANGEIFDLNQLTAAHTTLPMPSIVEVTNLQNGRSVQLRVNDRGPFVDGRLIDVSRRAAQLLGFETKGTTPVRVRILKDASIQVAEEAMHNGGGAIMLAQAASVPPPMAQAALQPYTAKGLPPSALAPTSSRDRSSTRKQQRCRRRRVHLTSWREAAIGARAERSGPIVDTQMPTSPPRVAAGPIEVAGRPDLRPGRRVLGAGQRAARAIAHRPAGQCPGDDGLGQRDRGLPRAARPGGERGTGGPLAATRRQQRLPRGADRQRLKLGQRAGRTEMSMAPRFVGFLIGALLTVGLACLPAAAKIHPKAKAAIPTPTATAAATPASGIDTEAAHAFIIEAETGAVLLDKGADERMPPASMSKMMTAYLVFDMLKKGRAKLDDELPVSENAWRTGGSKMFVPLGEHVKISDLMRGMIIQSGNDACVVLAEGLAGSERGVCRSDEPKGQADRS